MRAAAQSPCRNRSCPKASLGPRSCAWQSSVGRSDVPAKMYWEGSSMPGSSTSCSSGSILLANRSKQGLFGGHADKLCVWSVNKLKKTQINVIIKYFDEYLKFARRFPVWQRLVLKWRLSAINLAFAVFFTLFDKSRSEALKSVQSLLYRVLNGRCLLYV